MYKFITENGRDMFIRFYHKGGKRGNKQTPGRSPKATLCVISDNAGVKQSDGVAKPATEIIKPISDDINPKYAHLHYGNRFIRLLKTDCGKKLVALRGDNFCKSVGRKKALGKALTNFNKASRTNAWASVLGTV